jgi:hypothetical protein
LASGVTAKANIPLQTQPTFCRLLQRVDASKVEEVILAIQDQVRGPVPKEQLIVLDGKEPRHGNGASVLSAVSVPSQHYLGSALVDQKTNEVPVGESYLTAWSSKTGWSRWTPYTLRMKPPAPWSWNTGPIIS